MHLDNNLIKEIAGIASSLNNIDENTEFKYKDGKLYLYNLEHICEFCNVEDLCPDSIVDVINIEDYLNELCTQLKDVRL